MGANSVPFGDLGMPLGEHLTVATRDKILKGDYMDVFSLLEKDKDELDECLKEHIKWCTIDRTYTNWNPGFLIYAGLIVCHQLWRALSMLQYMYIIYKTYTDFLNHAWLQYDEKFHMRDFRFDWNRVERGVLVPHLNS